MPGKTPTGLDMTLTSVQLGDRLATLRRVASRVAEELDASDSAHHVERLAARLALLLKEIAELEPPEISATDEIQKRRAARRDRGEALSVDHTAAAGRGHG